MKYARFFCITRKHLMKSIVEVYPQVNLDALIEKVIEKGFLNEDEYLNPSIFLEAIRNDDVKINASYGQKISPYHLAFLVKDEADAITIISEIQKSYQEKNKDNKSLLSREIKPEYVIKDNYGPADFMAVARDFRKAYQKIAKQIYSTPIGLTSSYVTDKKQRNILHIAANLRRFEFIKSYIYAIKDNYFRNMGILNKTDTVLEIAIKKGDARFIKLAFDKGQLQDLNGSQKSYLMKNYANAYQVVQNPNVIDLEDNQNPIMVRQQKMDDYLRITQLSQRILNTDIREIIALIGNDFPIDEILGDNNNFFELVLRCEDNEIAAMEDLINAFLNLTNIGSQETSAKKLLMDSYNKIIIRPTSWIKDSLLEKLIIPNLMIVESLDDSQKTAFISQLLEESQTPKEKPETDEKKGAEKIIEIIYSTPSFLELKTKLLIKTLNSQPYKDNWLKNESYELTLDEVMAIYIDDETKSKLVGISIEKQIKRLNYDKSAIAQFYHEIINTAINTNDEKKLKLLIENLDKKEINYDNSMLDAHFLHVAQKALSENSLMILGWFNFSESPKDNVYLKALIETGDNLFDIKDCSNESIGTILWAKDKSKNVPVIKKALIEKLQSGHNDEVITLFIKALQVENETSVQLLSELLEPPYNQQLTLSESNVLYLLELLLKFKRFHYRDGNNTLIVNLIEKLIAMTPSTIDASVSYLPINKVEDNDDSSLESTDFNPSPSLLLSIANSKYLKAIDFNKLAQKLVNVNDTLKVTIKDIDTNDSFGLDDDSDSDDDLLSSFLPESLKSISEKKLLSDTPAVVFKAALHGNMPIIQWLCFDCKEYKLSLKHLATLAIPLAYSKDSAALKTYEQLIQKAIAERKIHEEQIKAEKDKTELVNTITQINAPFVAMIDTYKQQLDALKAQVVQLEAKVESLEAKEIAKEQDSTEQKWGICANQSTAKLIATQKDSPLNQAKKEKIQEKEISQENTARQISYTMSTH